MEERPPIWPLTTEERCCLQDLDVPYFDLPSDRTTLVAADGEEIEGLFEASGYQAVTGRIEDLSLADLGLQLVSLSRELESDGAAGTEPGPASWLEREARAVGHAIAERSAKLAGTDGMAGLDWLKPERFVDRPLSLNLYDGAAGVALFLAELAAVTEADEFRRLALRAVEPTEAWLEKGPTVAWIAPQGIGLCFGLGGLIHAWVEMASLLQEPRWVELALSAAVGIDAEAIGADRDFDLAGGAAGAIRGLLRLYDETRSEEVLRRAQACASHLLSHRRSTDEPGCAAWRSRDGRYLTGIAHGASGIASALLELYEVLANERYLATAREALRFERRSRAADGSIWWSEEPRQGQRRRSAGAAWCSGAAGIGLARIGAPEELKDPEVEKDLEGALAMLRASPRALTDSFCCGHGGGIELLLEAGLERGDAALLREGHARAAEMVGRKRRRGSFKLTAEVGERNAFDPTMFRGIAGIGHLLLRLKDPGRLEPLTTVSRRRRRARRAGARALAGGV
jgi:type 2 lantibiotic biosynthesis protein LanM